VQRQSRRRFLGLTAASALSVELGRSSVATAAAEARPFRVRTLTAGVTIATPPQLAPIERGLDALQRARQRFVDDGYEVQTVRVATPPFVAVDSAARTAMMPFLRDLDAMLVARGAIGSIGPVLTHDVNDESVPDWIATLLNETKRLSTSIAVASPNDGVYFQSTLVAARTIARLATATPQGLGNFRFAAAANVPAGTPFFPVAWHDGPASLALGLETAAVVEHAVAGAADARVATTKLRSTFNALLAPVDSLARASAATEGLAYLGIDTSPAPGLDRSIGAAIEAYVGAPFGSGTTLEACAAITDALRTLDVRTCGYSGLMLPVLEDPRLAQRATEHRFGWRDLLLYSSVCGTGLDVVPIPGDTSVARIAGIVRDMAALSAKYRKPLSARLFPVPGKAAGQMTAFSDPLLTNCAVFSVD